MTTVTGSQVEGRAALDRGNSKFKALRYEQVWLNKCSLNKCTIEDSRRNCCSGFVVGNLDDGWGVASPSEGRKGAPGRGNGFSKGRGWTS